MSLLASSKCLLTLGALLGFLGVALGAFGAHALKQKLSADLLAIFEVGVRYQMYHALAMCVVAYATGIYSSFLFPFSGWMFFLGTLIFSGSLYALALSGVKSWGAITPIGGIILLLAWLCLGVGALKA